MKFNKNGVLKVIAFFLAFTCIISINNTGVNAEPTDQITFTDSALEQKLISLGVDSGDSIITEGEMTAVTGRLDLSSSSISDLSGLEYATGVTSLDLSNNDISDVTALESLSRLLTLNISNNYLTEDSITNLQTALSSCTIESGTQKIKVDSITLEATEKTLCKGDSYNISATILPENATDKTLTYSSSNTSVATVSNTGVVTPIALGQTTITISAEFEVSTTCEINVISDEFDNQNYKINKFKSWMTGILPLTKLSSLRASFSNPSAYISVYDGSKKLGDNDYVGTGMVVKLTINGEVRDQLTLIVKGDASGDGKLSITDYTLARLDILNLRKMDSVQKAGADTSNDGKISITDYTKMRLHILNLRKLEEAVYYNPIPTGNSNVDRFIRAAFSVIDAPYQWGREIYDSTTDPPGADCSGFVYYSLHEVGYPMGRYTAATYSQYVGWEKVSKNEPQPGDLMFYYSDSKPGTIGHTGIYLGNGYHIHASSTYGCIIICKFEGWYLEHFSHGRRVY